MEQFMDVASQDTKLQVDISLPKANVYLPSKHLFELLYNRYIILQAQNLHLHQYLPKEFV